MLKNSSNLCNPFLSLKDLLIAQVTKMQRQPGVLSEVKNLRRRCELVLQKIEQKHPVYKPSLPKALKITTGSFFRCCWS